MIPIDADWLRRNPLPDFPAETNKNDRGRVLLVGGSTRVPGALRLTGEAALRAGAGKLQMATVADAALALGIMVPEAAVMALPQAEDGEIAPGPCSDALEQSLSACDTLVLGPGMAANDAGPGLVSNLLGLLAVAGAAVLDAAAINACRECAHAVRDRSAPVVLTPHPGEMAALTGRAAEWIVDNLAEIASEVAADLDAVIVLKSGRTVVCAPGAEPLLYRGGGPALATGGSGDVLAGILGGLLARGIDPVAASGWAVWAHGEAGRALTFRLGGPGLLARELLAELPRLLCSKGDGREENGAAGED